MRVLHVIPSVAPCRGGPSKAVIDMVRTLNEAGLNCEIATTNDNCEELLDVPLDGLHDYGGAPTRFFARYSPTIRMLREFQYSAAFADWMRREITGYDLIHVHAIFSFCSSYAMALARRNNIPYVVRPIGQLEDWSLAHSAWRKRLYRWLLEDRNLQRAGAIQFTAVSESEQAARLFPDVDSAVIPLGIGLPDPVANAPALLRQRWQLPQDQRPVIAWLSRIHPKKGLELMLQAMAELEDSEPYLVIAGSGTPQYIDSLKSQVTSLGLSEQVIWAGFVDGEDKQVLLQGADLFALTSYSENFGIAVLEALAAGAPPLVTHPVALSTEIETHDLGWVTDTDTTSIAAGLSNALDKISEMQDLRQRCREFVAKNFQWPAIAGQLSGLYQSLLKR